MSEQEVFIPPPVRGMTTENFYVDPREGWARLLRNMVVKQGSVRSRGDQNIQVALTIPSGTPQIIWHDQANEQYLWSDGVVRDADGATVYTGTIQSHPVFEARFRDQVYLFHPAEAAIRKNNGTWTTFGYTLASLSASTVIGAVPYRGRFYFWGGTTIEYGGLDAITGATVAYSIASFAEGGSILFCRVVTIESGLDSEDVFVAYLDNGLVLVFSGDDPGANNWLLIGSFRMTKPHGRLAFIDIEGDSIIMGEEYVYSTRDLFAQGSKAAAANNLSRPVQALYRQAVQQSIDHTSILVSPSFLESYPFAFYMKTENALVFVLGHARDIMNSDEAEWGLTGSDYYRRLQFVYFRDTQAWAVWDIPQLQHPVKDVLDTGVSRPTWAKNAVIMHYDWTFTEYGEDELVAYSTLTLSSGHTLGNGLKAGFVEHEDVWSTPMFLDRALRNAQVVGIRPCFQQDDGLYIDSCGVIGNGTDFILNEFHGSFIRDDSAAHHSLSAYRFTATNDQIDSPRLNVNIQKQFVHATVRKGDMLDGNNSARWTEYFGMTLYFTPGGTQ